MESMTVNGGSMMVKKFPPVPVYPVSETPMGLYFLSSLDQAIPFPMQTIYAFRSGGGETVADILKQSLAKALVDFYPLSGTMSLDSDCRFVVDCSGEKSVTFVEAVAECTIDMIGDLRVPDPDTTRKLIYVDPNVKSFLDLPLLTAQVTKFRCGGFTLGVWISHTVVDGVSGMTFVNSWAEIARGGSPPAPFHGRSLLRSRVPPTPKGPYDDFVQIADVSGMESLYEKERNVSRMFTFTAEKIAAVKKAALADGRLEGCSTFSAVAAMVWRARSRAMNMRPAQLTKLRILVDVRSKFKDPIPSNYFGNLVTTACCLTTAGELAERPLSSTVEHVRKACEMVDEDYIRSRIDYIEAHRPPLASAGTLVISSWTQLTFKACDFGWGEAVQFGCADVARELCVFIPESKGKRGVAVVMALPESAMNTFQDLVDGM